MNQFRQLLIISLLTLTLFFIFLEFFLIKNIKFLIDVSRYLPNTVILEKVNKIIYNENLKDQISILINKKEYYTYSKKKLKKSHPDDIKHGALNEWYYNSQGFCNKQNDKNVEIISIGDSFTFCTSIKPEETYVYNISKNLDDKKIYNYGLPGLGISDYTNILIDKINKKTKLIIYAIYEGNDFRSILYDTRKNSPSKEDLENAYKENNKENLIKIFLKKVFGNFYSFNYIYAVIKQQIKPYKEIFNFRYYKSYKNEKIKLNIGNSDIDEIHSAKLLVNENDEGFYTKLYNDKLKENMIKSNNYSKKFNSEIIFIYIPSAYSALNQDNLIFEDKKIGELVLEYSKISSKIFDDICQNNNLNCINTIKQFKAQNNQSINLTHFPHNVHLTPDGHKLIGKLINDFICDKKITNLNKYCF